MSKTYEIKTIKDIFDKVPMNRVEDCMEELTVLLMQAKSMQAAIYGVAHATTGDANNSSVLFPEKLDWMDDGNGKIDMNVTINDVDAGTISKTL